MRDAILIELFKGGLDEVLLEMQESGHWGGFGGTYRTMIVQLPDKIKKALADATERWAVAAKRNFYNPWRESEYGRFEFQDKYFIGIGGPENSCGKGDCKKIVPNELVAGYATGYIHALESISAELLNLAEEIGYMATCPRWPLMPALRRKYGIFAFDFYLGLRDEKKNIFHMELLRRRYGAENVILHESKWCAVDELHGSQQVVAVSNLVDLFTHKFKDKRTAAAAVSRCVTKMASEGLITKRSGNDKRTLKMTTLANLTADGYKMAAELAIQAGIVPANPNELPDA
jgi:hypothetical protein